MCVLCVPAVLRVRNATVAPSFHLTFPYPTYHRSYPYQTYHHQTCQRQTKGRRSVRCVCACDVEGDGRVEVRWRGRWNGVETRRGHTQGEKGRNQVTRHEGARMERCAW